MCFFRGNVKICKPKKDIQNKLFERYIKENAKHIKVVTIKGERVGFFDGKVLEDNTFKINNIFIIPKYQNNSEYWVAYNRELSDDTNAQYSINCDNLYIIKTIN